MYTETVHTEPTSRWSSRSSLRACVIMLFCAVTASGVGFLSSPLLYAIVAGNLGLLVLPIWYAHHTNRLDAFESVHAMGLRQFVYFGLGAIWTFEDPTHVAYDRYIVPYILPAAFVCLLGYAAFLAGYYVPWLGRHTQRKAREVPTTVWVVILPGIVGFVGAMAAAALAWATWADVSLASYVSSLGQLLPLYYFAWGLAWLFVFSPRTTRKQRLVLLGLFVPASMIIITAQLEDKSGMLMLAVVPLMALWYTRRKLPWKTLVAIGLLLVFVVFPVGNTIRLVDARLDTASRVQITSRMISEWDSAHYMDATLYAVKKRLALINSVAVVIRDVPRWVPYAHGETLFFPLFAYFVPRMLWPDKPQHTLGREFGVTFRVVNMVDEKTSIASTVTGELLWNFDLPGVLIGMALWGFGMRALYRRYGESTEPDPMRHAVHMVALVQFLHFGGGIAADCVGVARTLLLLEAYRWMARRTGLVRVEERAS
jgi:hypothetical protein